MSKFKNIKTKYWFFLIQVITIIIAYFIVNLQLLENINLNIYSQLIETRNKIINLSPEFENNKDKITIVWIDERFFSEESISSQWLHRWYYSKVIENIMEYDPWTIWIDVLFEKKYNFSEIDERSKVLNQIFETYDYELASSLNENIVIASLYDHNNNNFIKAENFFLQNNPSIWHVNSFVNKWYDLWIRTNIYDKNNEYKKPFSIKVYKKYKENSYNKLYWEWVWINININQSENFYRIDDKFIPISNMIYWLDFIFTPIYETNPNNFNYISLYDIFKNKEDYSEKFENNIVLIWATDKALQDIKPSLIWQTPWVIYHANQVISLLNNDNIYLLWKKQTLIIIIWIILINILIYYIFKFNWSNKFSLYFLIFEIFTLITVSILFSLLWIFIDFFSILIPIWTIILVIFIQLIFTTIYHITELNDLKNNFQQLFWLYVWKNIKNNNSNWDKTAESKNIAIYFSDIEWFTEISEKLSPKDNIKFLNIYLEKMSENISINKWFIDKYIGDAVMAFWENDDWVDLATRSAIFNCIEIEKVNKKIQEKIWKEIKLNTRIWLHYWESIVWDVWSEKYKLNYTIIWDNVNLAARLEWINKYYGTNICASEDFINKLKNKNDYFYRKLDKIIVKWKNKDITIYEIIPIFRKVMTYWQIKEYEKFINLFELWIEEYFKWNFQEAVKLFKESYILKNDDVSNIFIDRCNKLIKNNIKEWNWIWKFDTK